MIKNSAGFSIIEAVLAVAIVGLVTLPILLMQTNAASAIARRAGIYKRVLAGYSMQINDGFDPSGKETAEEQMKKPQAQLSLATEKIAKDSSLGALEGIQQKKVVISWVTRNKKKSEQLIAYVFRPPQEKK